MRSKTIIVTALLGVIVAPVWSGAEEPSKIVAPNVSRDGVALESMHAFVPAQPSWVRKHTYYDRDWDEDTFISWYLERRPVRGTPRKNLYEKVSYYEDATDEAKCLKVLTYYPDGSVQSEEDFVGQQSFGRSFYMSGKQRSYWEKVGYNFVRSIELDPDGKVIRPPSGDAEPSTRWDDDGRAYQQIWSYRGRSYLWKKYRGGVVVRTWLLVPRTSRNLDFTVQHEKLMAPTPDGLKSHHEYWNKVAGQKPTGYVLSGDVSLNDPPPPQLKSEDYAARRATFIQQYSGFLAAIGQSWESLGIEEVKAGL